MKERYQDINSVKLREAGKGNLPKVDSGIGAVVIGGDYQGLGIVRNLSEQGIPVRLIDYELSIGRFSKRVQKFYQCPHVSDEMSFVEFLVALADREGLHEWVLFPTNDQVAALLSRHKKFLSRFFRIWTPGWGTMSQVYDKRLTHKLAERTGVNCPKTITERTPREIGEQEIRFPVIIKPAVKDAFFAATKRKALPAKDRKELIERFEKIAKTVDPRELMIQEVIPGGSENQYSYCALFKNGEPRARLMARRTRQHPMDFGHASTFVETVDVPEIEKASLKLLKALDYYGLCEVEFKFDKRDKKYKVLEINARTWGWHSLGRRAGVNFSYLMFLDQVGVETMITDYRVGVKWLRFTTDFPTFLKEWLGGRMKLAEYMASLSGEKELAVFSLKDPLPFFVELAIAPYLRKKRGF
jgi:D-aspartate ligase